MKQQVVDWATCPRCGEECGIDVADSHRLWLPRAMWECPECGERTTTAVILGVPERRGSDGRETT